MSKSTHIPQIRAINIPISEDVLLEYQQLSKAQKNKQLDPNHRKRLLELTDIIEEVEVRRYENLIKLSKEYKMTVPELKMKMDISSEA